MTFILTFILASVIGFVASKILIHLAPKLKLIDDPKKRNHPAILHKKATPRAGGVAIFVSFLICSTLLLPLTKELGGIILGALILVVVGVIDDKYEIPNTYKLLAQLLAAVVVVGSGVGISYITNPFLALFNNLPQVIKLDDFRIVFDFLGTHSIVVWADLFAIFWIVWVINMVNFSSGVDGQLPGIAIVSLIVIFIASLRFFPQDSNQVTVGILALAGAGATLGFLFFNYYPAKIFPGDSGSYFLGYLIATLSILSGAKVGAALLVMAIPLIDGVFTIIRRIASGKSPFRGDRKHLHHMLMQFGMTQSQVALFYWLLCAILGAIALFLSSSEKVFAGAIIAIIVIGGLLWLNMNLPDTDQK